MYFYKKGYQDKSKQQNPQGLNILTRKRTPTPQKDEKQGGSINMRNQNQIYNTVSNINLANHAYNQNIAKQPPRHPNKQSMHQPMQSMQDAEPVGGNQVMGIIQSPGVSHPDTSRNEQKYDSYFNQSNQCAKSDDKKQLKGTDRISKISAKQSNISKLTTKQTEQKKWLEGQYGIRNLSHSRSRSKIKKKNNISGPKGDVSPESPDFRTPEENIGSYFIPKSNPGGLRMMNHKVVSISGASDIQEFKRKFKNQQQHNQILQQNIPQQPREAVPHIRIVMRKDKNSHGSKQISHISRPFGEIGLQSLQQSASNFNDNYSASGMPLDTEQNQDKGYGGTIYNTFSKLAQNINNLARQSMRSESFEDKEPLAHFGIQKSPDNEYRDRNQEVNDSYFNDINVPQPQQPVKHINETIRESKEFYDDKLEIIRSSDQLAQNPEKGNKDVRNSDSFMEQKTIILDKSLNVSDREKMATLQKLSDQLNDLNNNLMNKLSDKIQMNFEQELLTIRSLSHISRSRVSSNSRSRGVTPKQSNTPKGRNSIGTYSDDGSGSYKRTTLISGLTFDDLSNMDISESDIIKQSKQADMKIQLLQKQIVMMEQRAKLEGLTNRMGTEENPINIYDLGRQSQKDVKNYGDLLNQDDFKDEFIDVMKNNNSQIQSSIGVKQVDEHIKNQFTPSQNVEHSQKSEIQSLLDNLPQFNKDGGLLKDQNNPYKSKKELSDDFQSPRSEIRIARQIQVKEDYINHNDQKYIDKIQDRQLVSNPVINSGDSMIKMAKEFEEENNEKELQELISIKSQRSKVTEKQGFKKDAIDSIQTFKENKQTKQSEIYQSSSSTQMINQGKHINYSSQTKQNYTIVTNQTNVKGNQYQINNQTQDESPRLKSFNTNNNGGSPDKRSEISSVQTDRTIDNQYVDQLNLLITLLGSDKDTSFYGNQCQIFVGCHKTYLKQREVWNKLKAKSLNIQIAPPKPDIPCERVIGGLNMMKDGIKSHFQGIQEKNMFSQQIEMQFYMVITLLEGFKKQLDEEEKDFIAKKKPQGINNNTQYFDAKKLDSMSQKSFSVKSQAVKGVGMSEQSFRQSQTYGHILKNTGYEQTIYKNNASEQGLMAASRNKIRQSNSNELENTIGNQSVMSQPISKRILFVGAGALDSPKMDDCSDNSIIASPILKKNKDLDANKQIVVEEYSEQFVSRKEVPRKQTFGNIQSAQKPKTELMEAHRPLPIQNTDEQPNRRTMIKREDHPEDASADISASPINIYRAQESYDISAPGKNALINGSNIQSRSSNSVFASIKSPGININQNRIQTQGKNEKNLNSVSTSQNNMDQQLASNLISRPSYQQSLLDSSVRSNSKMSAQERLYNAKGKLNGRLEKEAEKMSSQAPSVTRSIGGVKIPDNARELSQTANRNRMKSPNIFKKKQIDVNDDGSKSRSRSRVNIFARDLSQGNTSARLGNSRASVGNASGNNYSDFGNGNNMISFKEFTKLSNNILRKFFMNEQYAQLVSIPSLYKMMSKQLLSGIQDDISQKELEEKVNDFIKIEYRKQINAYKAQFQEPQSEMKQTPQPAMPRNEETSADRIPLSPHQKYEIKPINSGSGSQIKIQNVTYSFAGQSSANFQNNSNQENDTEGQHLKKLKVNLQTLKDNESKFDSQDAQLTLGNESKSTSPKVTSPTKLERKNLFGGNNKSDDISGTASSKRKRSRIVDKSESRNNIELIKSQIQDNDNDNRDIHLVLDEMEKSETMKNSQSYGNNSQNLSNGTPRFKNKKINLQPAQSISSSIYRIPPSISSTKNASPKADPYKRASKGHTKVTDSSHHRENSNRMSTQSNNSAQKPPRKSAKRITYDEIKNPFGSTRINK